jgi:hypothetical protein
MAIDGAGRQAQQRTGAVSRLGADPAGAKRPRLPLLQSSHWSSIALVTAKVSSSKPVVTDRRRIAKAIRLTRTDGFAYVDREATSG